MQQTNASFSLTEAQAVALVEQELGRRRSEATRKTYASLARHFARHHKGDLSRPALLAYLDTLINEGKSHGYLKLSLAVLRILCRALGQECPITARDLPAPDPDALGGRALSQEEVDQLVRAAMRGLLTPQETAYLCLSTLYGLRREELTRVQIGKGEITVRLAKGGGTHRHLIPQGILPFLKGYRPLGTPIEATVLWHSLRAKAGLPKQKGDGWHTIRRALVVSLMASGISPEQIARFVGWRQLGTWNPVFHYYRPPISLDTIIFQNNQFLNFWLNKAKLLHY